MAVLHEPLRIGGTTHLRNRIYRAPVLEGAGDGDDCGDVYAKHFVENARHGVGLIVQGSACLYPEGRTSPGMTTVDTRDHVMRLAPMVAAVHAEGAAIWLQVGHGGLYSMERWHEPFASDRTSRLRAVSKPPWYLRPVFPARTIEIMSTADVYAMAEKYGDVAMWAREAGYDGLQLASSNAKLLDQFLSPFYNRRDDEFGGDLASRALVLKLIREAIAARAGDDFTVSVKVPVGEKSIPGAPHTTVEEGLALTELVEEWGFDAVTPVEVSVFPDTTLSRGGIPRSIWNNAAIAGRFAEAAPNPLERRVIGAGYWLGGKLSPFRPVWNRPHFNAAKRRVDIPVFAVGGIRTSEQVAQILDNGEADAVGIGRPFYAEPDLAARFLGHGVDHTLCENSNLCVPAQMLGMRGVCYNPEVTRARVALRRRSSSEAGAG